MPPFTPIREFVDALQSGETNITRRLKYLYDNHASIEPSLLGVLRTGSLTPFPAAIKALLRGEGGMSGLPGPNVLRNAEITHLEGWAAELPKVQGWIDTAIANGWDVRFFWELHREPGVGDYAHQDPGPPVTITFRTAAPRVNLSPSLGSVSYT